MAKRTFQKENDDIIGKIRAIYKRKCETNNVPQYKAFRDKLEAIADSGEIRLVQLTGHIGPVGIRSVFDTLLDTQYKALMVVRLWRAGVEDEGLRVICNYINSTHSLQQLDLLENGITALGCEFLAKTLSNGLCQMTKLKLEGNLIGTQGLRVLATGLNMNKTIQKLSLRNCGIGEGGGRILQIILANINSSLRVLKVCQNPLGLTGLSQILRALKSNDLLTKFKASDISVELVSTILDDQQQTVLRQLHQVLLYNKVITHYDLRFNPVSDKIGQQLISTIQENKCISEFQISETIDLDLRSKLKTILESRIKKTKVKASRPKKKP